MANIEEKVENLVKQTIEENGYDLYDVEYAKEGKDYFLRIIIDGEKGIQLEDCEKIHYAINDLLEKADYIKEMYFLEVSSPGVERILRKDRHLEAQLGKKIVIKLFRPINAKKELIGILKQFNKEKIELETDGIIEIQRKNISLIKQYYDWEQA